MPLEHSSAPWRAALITARAPFGRRRRHFFYRGRHFRRPAARAGGFHNLSTARLAALSLPFAAFTLLGVPLSAPRPPGWAGANWASAEGTRVTKAGGSQDGPATPAPAVVAGPRRELGTPGAADQLQFAARLLYGAHQAGAGPTTTALANILRPAVSTSSDALLVQRQAAVRAGARAAARAGHKVADGLLVRAGARAAARAGHKVADGLRASTARAAATPAQPPRSYLGNFMVTCYDLYGQTASGAMAGPDSVAVDPSVIPLGTQIYVDGVGPRVADDTGGAIIGYHIDIWEPSYNQCADWGVQTRPVYRVNG